MAAVATVAVVAAVAMEALRRTDCDLVIQSASRESSLTDSKIA